MRACESCVTANTNTRSKKVTRWCPFSGLPRNTLGDLLSINMPAPPREQRRAALAQRPGDVDFHLETLGAWLDRHVVGSQRGPRHRPRPWGGGVFGDRQDRSDIGTGAGGIELGPAQRIGHCHLARFVPQLLRFGHLKGDTTDLIDAEADDLIEHLTQALELARRDAHLIDDLITNNGGGLILDAAIARFDIEGRRTDVLGRNAKRLESVD